MIIDVVQTISEKVHTALTKATGLSQSTPMTRWSFAAFSVPLSSPLLCADFSLPRELRSFFLDDCSIGLKLKDGEDKFIFNELPWLALDLHQ